MRRTRRDSLTRDVIDNKLGQFNIRDEGEGGWPEGMDRHTRDMPIPKKRKRLLDDGAAGSTIVTLDSALTLTYPLLEARGDEIEPDQVTVHCSLLNATTYAPEPNLTLNLEWGIQNFIANAELDLINGMMFSLMASYVRLSVTSNPSVTTGVLRIGASLSYGIRAAHAPPQKTLVSFENPLIAPGNEGSAVAVPSFARGVYTMPLPNGAGVTQVDFVMQQRTLISSGVLSIHPYVVGGIVSPLRIPLLNNCRFIDIRNVDAVDSLRAAYVFDLAF